MIDNLNTDKANDKKIWPYKTFDKVYTENYLSVYNFLRSRYNMGHERAEDLTQKAFIRAFKNHDNFRRETSYRTRVMNIAISTAKNDFRAKMSPKRIMQESATSIHDSEGNQMEIRSLSPSPLIEIETKEHLIRAGEAIDKLPFNMRLTLMLYLKGKEYNKIAKITGKSIGTVKSRIYRARKLVRKKAYLDGDEFLRENYQGYSFRPRGCRNNLVETVMQYSDR